MTDTSQTDNLETEARNENVSVPLAGVHISVPPMNKWRSSALSAMQRGDFELWAERTLSEKDYARWQDVDPMVDEIDPFFEEVMKRMGLDQGKSGRSSGSSRNKRKR